jgi:hypothetical protein
MEHWRRCEKWNAIAQRIRGARWRSVPRVSIRGRTFVALLGPAIEEGIAGFGDSVEAALRALDVQYARSLTSPADRD